MTDEAVHAFDPGGFGMANMIGGSWCARGTNRPFRPGHAALFASRASAY